jgi:hypothetical protein
MTEILNLCKGFEIPLAIVNIIGLIVFGVKQNMMYKELYRIRDSLDKHIEYHLKLKGE